MSDAFDVIVIGGMLLGLEPDGERLGVSPHLPPLISELALRRIPGRWGHADASSSRGEG